MKIIVLGASGMLGQALMAEGKARGYDVIGDRVDITQYALLNRHIKSHDPHYIINAAALTDLEACEQDLELAYKVNTSPIVDISNVVKYNNLRARLIQISSDQCQLPLNNYAISKRFAELLCPYDALIIRTNIVRLRS